mmetsp:Transcript_5702/g.12731  ORF Transcript_5702/g.12731 Transcript_5702/m.12731 type:complete len:945 (-) Transcript_5702:65-2899(-)
MFGAIDKISDWIAPHHEPKCIYSLSEGSAADEAFLSRKAASLCEIHRLGFSVPPAFIVSVHAAQEYNKSTARELKPEIVQMLKTAVDDLAKSMGKGFGSTTGPAPLLLSVRCGAMVSASTDVSFEDDPFLDSVNTDLADSMGAPDSWCIPGVKESCLGIGMNDQVAAHLATLTSPFTAYNTYAHFLLRFGTIVCGMPRSRYNEVLNDHVEATGRAGMNLTREDLIGICDRFKAIVEVPQCPFTQLHMAVLELYSCWYSPTAMEFRSEGLGVDPALGTAIIVQSIAFGNTGVCFSRCPVTGMGGIAGTFWSKTGDKCAIGSGLLQSDETAFLLLAQTAKALEGHFRDMIQFEFVHNAEENTVHVLQVQAARRSPKAAMRLAVDLVESKVLTEREALLRVDAAKASFFLHQHMAAEQLASPPFSMGVAASRGVVTGPLAFTAAECMELSSRGDVVLCLQECSAHDARAIRSASAMITISGGIFSNAAILCRGMGKPCVTRIRTAALLTNPDGSKMLRTSAGDEVRAGEVVTVDGTHGRIFTGLRPCISFFEDPDFQKVLGYADKFRRLRVHASISTLGGSAGIKEQVMLARRMGADALGCVSTDGLFYSSEERLALVRNVLVERNTLQRAAHLRMLGELHREDLRALLRAGDGRSVGVKLLDLPLGMFLPSEPADMVAFAQHANHSVADVKRAVASILDADPDMGLRGCRIATFCPEITEMQVRAVACAVLDLLLEDLPSNPPKILVPMLVTSHELQHVLALVDRVGGEVRREYEQVHPQLAALASLPLFTVEALIDTPRACLRAETLAACRGVSSVSLCSGQVTALTFGCTRTDAEKFFPQYIYNKIYLADPFRSLDDMAVGTLLGEALRKCKGAHRGIQCSVIDEDHTSDPRSIDFLASYGVDVLVCPPMRAPLARLCAAQAEVRASNKYLFDLESQADQWMFW